MGLDGISINQLRAVPERTSAEMNSAVQFNLNQTNKVVDGLSQGQRVDPDRENQHENPQSNQNFSSGDESALEDEKEEVIKYDLSNSSKYMLKLDEGNNKIMIIEKASGVAVQTIDADELSRFVSFAVNTQGSLVNKKL